MTPLIIFLRTIEQNVAYGCHTELARFNLSIFTRGGDCLTSGQSYKSLKRFIDPNWDTNILHKLPMRFNDIHSLILFRFESTTGLGHTYEYSTPLPIPLNPKLSGQCFNRRALMRFMSHHTLTLPLGSWVNPGMLTGNSERYWKSAF